MPNTILTGLQPTGELHIGNYFGAILPMLQKSKELTEGDKMYFFVPDLHTLSVDIDHQTLYNTILANLKVYLASGIAINSKSINFFRQSFVPAHSEIQWLLSCFTYFGEASRMTQFKDKSSEHEKNVNIGLFCYPILMAGDILLYNSDYIPVGEDQQQHLELARDLAIRINNKFDQDVFTVPKVRSAQMEFFGLDKALRIRSLSDPNKKMSKSSPDTNSKILLSDEPKIAAKKIMRATTDDLANINWDFEKQPGITNLLQIFQCLTNKSQQQVIFEWQGQSSYGNLKTAVSIELEKFLIEFQSRLSQIDEQTITDVLKRGEIAANSSANLTLLKFQKVLGLRI